MPDFGHPFDYMRRRYTPQSGAEHADFTNSRVTANALPQNEPTLAVDPLNPAVIVVAANDFRAGRSRIGLYRSSDCGLTFGDCLLPLPGKWTLSSDPVAGCGPSGNFIVAAVVFNAGVKDGTIVSYRSGSGSPVFLGPTLVNAGTGTLVFNDKPYLAVDTWAGSPFGGRVYVSYTRFTNNFNCSVINLQFSADGGATWSAPVAVSQTVSGDSFVQGSSLAAGPSGDVYAGFLEFSTDSVALLVRRSENGGVSFGTAPAPVTRFVPVPEHLPVPGWAFRVPTFSYLAAGPSPDPDKAHIYAVWQAYEEDVARIMLSRSEDRGETWSMPVHVSPLSGGNVHSFFPFVTVSPATGAVRVIFYSNRLSDTLLDVFAATSVDGGLTFSDTRVTNQSFNPNADPFFGEPCPFIGDYIWAVHQPDGSLLAVWTDTREQSQDIFLGRPL